MPKSSVCTRPTPISVARETRPCASSRQSSATALRPVWLSTEKSSACKRHTKGVSANSTYTRCGPFWKNHRPCASGWYWRERNAISWPCGNSALLLCANGPPACAASSRRYQRPRISSPSQPYQSGPWGHLANACLTMSSMGRLCCLYCLYCLCCLLLLCVLPATMAPPVRIATGAGLRPSTGSSVQPRRARRVDHMRGGQPAGAGMAHHHAPALRGFVGHGGDQEPGQARGGLRQPQLLDHAVHGTRQGQHAVDLHPPQNHGAFGKHRRELVTDGAGAQQARPAGPHVGDVVIVRPAGHQFLDVAMPQGLVERRFGLVRRTIEGDGFRSGMGHGGAMD